MSGGEIFITVLIVIVSVVMALFVLIQNPKGGGLASGFTGGNQIGGVQKTADFLEKGSWTLMVALFVLCIVSASFMETTTVELDDPATIEQNDGVGTNEGAAAPEE